MSAVKVEVSTTKQELMLVDGVLKAVRGGRLYVCDRVSKFEIRLIELYAEFFGV